MSEVWRYFKRSEEDRETAICILCERSLQCRRGCTSGLKKHCESIHKIRISSFNLKTKSHKKIAMGENGNYDIVEQVEKFEDSKPLKNIVKDDNIKYDVIVPESGEEFEDYEIVFDEQEMEIGENSSSVEEKPVLEQKVSIKVEPVVNNNFIWNYFERSSEMHATCLECNKTLLCRDNHIKGLLKHYNDHQLLSDSNKKTVEEETPDVSEEILAKLFSIDNIPMRTLSSSAYFKITFDHRRVQNAIEKFFRRSKNQTKRKIWEILENNEFARFSLILDNSLGMRYSKILITTNNIKAITLGAIRNDNTFLESLHKKLNDFGLDLNKLIVSATVPLNTVKLKCPQQQRCYNNALHLAVSDVLYTRFSPPSIFNDSSSESDSEMEVYSHTSKFNANIQKILSEVRQTIKLFKKDSIKNEVLQEFIVQKHGKCIPLILNSKTKWSTLEPMLTEFVKVYDCICSALSDLNEPKIKVQKEVLEDLLKSLKPIMLSITALHEKDSTLLTAEGVLEFLFESLSEEKLSYCFAFNEAIKRRIKECRNEELVELMRYLQTGEYSELKTPEAREHLVKLAFDFIKRLWSEDESAKVQENPPDKTLKSTTEEKNEDDVTMDPLERRLKAAINNSLRRSINNPVKITRFQRLQKDFSIFEHSGKLSPDLSRLLEALKTIRPSCTDSERVFKVPSHFCPIKKYSSLELLNMKVFLKGFFDND